MATKLNTLLESPGISINERDLSQITTNVVGTNIFIPGFTPQGPTDEPTSVSSLSEFEELFGIPTTDAEKYSHNAVKQILTTSNAAVTFTRMPYGSGAGYGFAETYNALVFPIVGLSATEVNACDYYRKVDEQTCKVDFPWLYNYFTPQSICYGSSNLECPLSSTDEVPGYVYIHDHPFEYNSIMTGFKFVVDSDSVAENLKIVQLRPTVNGTSTTYSVVTSFQLSAIYTEKDENQSNLSNDSKRLLANLGNSVYGKGYAITSGPLSGQTVSGVPVAARDVFATYSNCGSPVLKFYNADQAYAGTYRSLIGNTSLSSESVIATSLSDPSYVTMNTKYDSYLNFNVGTDCSLTLTKTVSAGTFPTSAFSFTLSAVRTGNITGSYTIQTSAVAATTQDTLISFCGVPVDAGLSCSTITSLGLTVPEEDRYTFTEILGDATLNDANFYALGEPISKTLNAGEYQLLQNGQFNWKCGVYENGTAALDVVNNDVRAGIVVVNKLKTAQLEDFTGYYLALNDNLNVNPATDFDDLTAVAGYYQDLCPGVSGDWVNVPGDRLNFQISAPFDGNAGSITELVHQNAGVEFGTDNYVDSLIVSLFKVRPSRLTETINKLDQVRVEQFIGSLNSERKVHDDFGGPDRSFFLEKSVNNASKYLDVMVNPYLSQNNCWVDNATNKPQKTVRMFREKTSKMFGNFSAQNTLKNYSDKMYGTGSYTGGCRDLIYDMCIKKDIGNLPAKLERALRSIENPIEYPIDLTIDNGLSTIWATRYAASNDHCITDPTICYNYDDTYFVNTDSLSPYDGTVMNSALQDNWEVIFNIFDSFARYTRKSVGGVPHLHIQDPLRQIFVNGKDYKIVQRQKSLFIDPATNQPSEKYASFGRNIYAYLRNLYQGINSSYSASYANWIKSYDSNTDSFSWFGSSAYEAALYARNDYNQYPWTSPLGVAYGQLANVNDIAINPNQRERDLISRIGLNPIVKFPEGYLNWNSVTLLKESSALKEISIRRGALWLAKSIQSNLVSFIGQPNTITTRTRIVNVLKPVLDFMKDNNGLYDYIIVCDERNNKISSIDQGVLNVAVYVKPTRPVKFILVDLVITGSGVNFSELI